MSLTISPASAADSQIQSLSQCKAGAYCVYTGYAYTGAIWMYTISTNLRYPYTSSIYNNRSTAVIAYSGINQTGSSLCVPPRAQLPQITNMLLTAKSIRLTAQTSC